MHYWAALRIFVDRQDAPLGLAELGRIDIVNQVYAYYVKGYGSSNIYNSHNHVSTRTA